MKLLNKILLATDFGDSAGQAVKQAIRLAKLFNSEILVLHVIPSMEMSKLNREMIEKGVRTELKNVFNEIRSQGIKVSDIGIQIGIPFIRIIQEAEKHNANLIVIGDSNGRNASDKLGVTSLKVLHKSAKPVWISKSGAKMDIQNVLCPVDFSRPAERALKNAIHLSRKMKAKLHILHAVPSMSDLYLKMLGGSEEKQSEKILNHEKQLNRFIEKFDFHDVDFAKMIAPGNVYKVILEAAKSLNADLIVMGTSGESDNPRILTGSNTEHVLRELPCSIVTLKSENVIEPFIDYQISDLQSHYNLAMDFLKNGMPQEAMEQFRYCVEKDTLFAPAWEGIAESYERLGYHESAEEHWLRAKSIRDRLWQKKVEAEIKARHELINSKNN
ncbi:MAG: universal stress protein [Calditrichaeota bacterium]|nr:universal stress protein [Calditrichota bacterium]